MTSMVRSLFAMLLLGLGVGWGAAPAEAQYYRYPPPYYAPPPVYHPPPVYYAPAPPPPAYRDLNRAYDPDRDGPLGYPTQRGPVLHGSMCYAGNYTCQLSVAGPVGSGCSCPGLGAPSYGSIR